MAIPVDRQSVRVAVRTRFHIFAQAGEIATAGQPLHPEVINAALALRTALDLGAINVLGIIA